MNDRLWYELGWDFASYDVKSPDHSISPMLIGYKEGKVHFKKPIRKPDRFVRKWLQLRFNALCRNRQFDVDVNPDFLATIDTPTCPVTYQRLTHGTLTETDWSVDRIVNDGAYSRQNLVIMSVKANIAKGSMSFVDILMQVQAGEACDPVLKHTEWRRLLSLVFLTHFRAGAVPEGLEDTLKVIPIPPFYPMHLPRSLGFHVQNFITLLATDRALRGKYLPLKMKRSKEELLGMLKAASNAEGLKILNKMLSKMESKALEVSRPEFLMWYDAIYMLFCEWLSTNPDEQRLQTFVKGLSFLTSEIKKEYAEQMSRHTGGYITD